jgi:hypothetical protein
MMKAGPAVRMGEKKNACQIWMVKPEGKSKLDRLTCRWDDCTEVNRREKDCESLGWVYFPQDMDTWRAIVSTVMNLGVT